MPTADEYAAGARRWTSRAESVDGLAESVAWSLPESSLGPCPVRSLLDDTLGVSVQNVANIADEFRDLAGECVRRSVACTTFDVALQLHRARLAGWTAMPEDERGPRPVPPDPPFPWVEASS